MKRPNFFILGGPKCGSTSLAAWLSQNPWVYISPVKEPRYFNTDLLPRQRRFLKEYEGLFADAKPEHIAVGEATTTYLYSEVAVPRILDYAERPRFIVMVRNPVQMAYSLHDDKLYRGDEHIKDFARAWQLQDRRARGEAVTPLCRDPQLLLYGPFCRLGLQLERLYGWVSADHVCVIVLDDVMGSPRREYLRVLDFLDVPDDGCQTFPVHNPAKERRSDLLAWLSRILEESQKRAEAWMGVPRHRGLGILKFVNRWNTRRRERPALSAEMEVKLKRYFADDVERLSGLLERDLTHWIVD